MHVGFGPYFAQNPAPNFAPFVSSHVTGIDLMKLLRLLTTECPIDVAAPLLASLGRTESEPVSMSRETTFDRDLHAVRDKAELSRIFTDLCVRVAQDLQRKGPEQRRHWHR